MTRSQPFSRSVTWGRWADRSPRALKIRVWLNFEFSQLLRKVLWVGLQQPTPPSTVKPPGTAPTLRNACSQQPPCRPGRAPGPRRKHLPGHHPTRTTHEPPSGAQGSVAVGRLHHGVHVVRSLHRLQSPGPQPPPWFKSLLSATLGPITVLCH